jgi:hypothetical protein
VPDSLSAVFIEVGWDRQEWPAPLTRLKGTALLGYRRINDRLQAIKPRFSSPQR